MSGKDSWLENKVVELLEVRQKHDLDNDKFLLLLGMVNLMGIINLLQERAATGEQGGVNRRSPTVSEVAPFNIFGGPRGKAQT